MVTRYSAYRPLNWWPFATPMHLHVGVWVKPTPITTPEGTSLWEWALSRMEADRLKKVPTWVCCDFRDLPVLENWKKARAMQFVQNVVLAMQVVAPAGGEDSQTVLFEHRAEGLASVSVWHRPPMRSTPWARVAAFNTPTSLPDVQTVVRRVLRAFAQNVVRLVNPLYLLEYGLEATNPHIRVLFWVTALEGLLMSVRRDNFKERLFNLLGERTFVFPPIDIFGFGQPKYRVGEVAEDLYELRSVVAHGGEIPAKFALACGFRDVSDTTIEVHEKNCLYLEVLEECALFLLCRALRYVFVSGLDRKVYNASEWRQEVMKPYSTRAQC